MPAVTEINPLSPLNVYNSIRSRARLGVERFLEDDLMERCTLIRALQMQRTSSQDINVTKAELRASSYQFGILSSQVLVDYKCMNWKNFQSLYTKWTRRCSSCQSREDIQR